MSLVDTKIVDGFKFEIHVDEDFYSRPLDIDFDSLHKRERFVKRLENGDIIPFGVIKFKRCECCGQWVNLTSLWSMIHETSDEAFEEFRKNYDTEEVLN